MPEVLRQRDFRLLLLGQSVSAFGDRMLAIALAFAVLGLGGSASEVGLVLACRTLPLVGCLLVGGVLADRTSRRAVMVGADLVRLASQGAVAVLLVAGLADVWTLALLAGITGAATGFFNPASTGLLPAIVAPELLQEANGVRATAMGIGEILGPIVAGVLVATAGPGWALGIDAITFAISAACLVRLRLGAQVGRAAVPFLHDLCAGWAAFRSRTWVWACVGAGAMGNLIWGAWSVLGPVVADRDLGGATVWGVVLAATGAGALGGGLVGIRARPGRPLLTYTLVGFLLAVPLALLAAGAPPPLLAVGAMLSGGALFLGHSLWESTLQRHIPADSLSRVSAYDWFGSLAFQPVGQALWGPVSVAIGIGSALWLAAGLWVLTLLALLAVPDVRRLPAYA